MGQHANIEGASFNALHTSSRRNAAFGSYGSTQSTTGRHSFSKVRSRKYWLQGEVPQVLGSLSSIKSLVQYYWLYRIHPQINPAYKLNPTLQVVPVVIAFKQCAIQSGYKTG